MIRDTKTIITGRVITKFVSALEDVDNFEKTGKLMYFGGYNFSLLEVKTINPCLLVVL